MQSVWVFLLSLLPLAAARPLMVFQGDAASPLAPLHLNQENGIANEYIVTMKPGVQNSDAVLQVAHVEASQVMHQYSASMHGFAARLTEDQVALLRQQPQVAMIEQNQPVSVYKVQENPPSWGLPRVAQREFRSRAVYTYPDTAGKDVDVYVIDTGIQINHEDFEGRAVWGLTAPEGDEDADGNGHGTHVASTIGGVAYGVAKEVNLIAVKVLRSSGYGTMADVIRGVDWTAEQHQSKKNRRSVANMSLGGGRSPALDLAVQSAIQAGVHFAVAAGNNNADACRYSPAAVEKAVTVGASTSSDGRASFSNVGSCVDIFAPGLDITGAWIGSNTAKRTISGTSMASPHVAGVMALFLGDQEYNTEEMKQNMLKVATEGVLSGLPRNTINLLLHHNYDPSQTEAKKDLYF